MLNGTLFALLLIMRGANGYLGSRFPQFETAHVVRLVPSMVILLVR